MIKRLFHPAVIVTASLLLVLFAANIVHATRISEIENSTRAASFQQATSTPLVEEDLSEVGSTDGIVIMGGVIVLVVLLPIIAKRKSWMQTE